MNLSSPFLGSVCIPVSFLILWLWSLITSLEKEFLPARPQEEINRNPEPLGWLLFCKKLGIMSPHSQLPPAQCLTGTAQLFSLLLCSCSSGLVTATTAVPFVSSSVMAISFRGGSWGAREGPASVSLFLCSWAAAEEIPIVGWQEE